MYSFFGSLWIKQFLYHYRAILYIGMRLRRIPIYVFSNRMVVVHPSLSKDIDTRSANTFWEEGIEGLLTG